MTASSSTSSPSHDGQHDQLATATAALPCTYIPTNSTTSQQISTGNNVALGLIGGTFVCVLALTTPFILAQLQSPLPYMATPRHKIEKALEFIANRSQRRSLEGANASAANRQQKAVFTSFSTKVHDDWFATPHNQRPTFVDLGSGDGTAILTAASLGYNATGFELNPTLWFLSSLRQLFSTNPSIRSNSRFIWGDMFQNDIAKLSLRNADCVMIFGVNSLMPQIANLVQRECHRPGCLIMSYRFRVPLLLHSSVEKNIDTKRVVGGVDATMIYDEEEMRIYELNNTTTV